MTRIAPVPNIDIRPDHWDIVRDILQKHVPHYAVWAFGSRAKWTAKQYSDLDLAIITDQPLSLDTSASLADDFSESDLPWKVDIVDWAATSESFRKVIELDKVVVQEAKKGWREVSLGEVCQQQGGSIQTGPFGSQLHASDYTDVGVPVVMPVNLINGNISEQNIARIPDDKVARLARHKLAPGDIVFSRRGDVTRFALVSKREAGWLCGTGCPKVSIGNWSIAKPGFIAAVLASAESKEWLIRHAVGATMPNLNTEILAGIPITLPPLPEQRAIAHILGTLDDKIDLNRRINQTLEAMAQAIFKSWFVDFDPVKAKIAAKQEGRDPLRAAMSTISGAGQGRLNAASAGCAGAAKPDAELDALPPEQYEQLAATAALFPDEMEESELGEIPRGWEVAAFGDIAAQGKGSVNPANAPEQIFLHYSLPAFDVAQLPLHELGESIKSNKTPVPSNSVLVSKLNPHIPRIWLVGNAGEKAICSTEFIVWKPKQPANNAFIYCLASSPEFNNVMRQLVTGTSNSHQRVKPDQLANIRVIAIHNDAIKKFSESTKPLMESLLCYRLQSKTLADLRDTLLPKLLSGELSVENILTESETSA